MKKYFALSLLIALSIGLFCLSEGPDYDLHFKRIIPSPLQVDQLERNLSSTTRWPQWFHSLDKVSRIELGSEGEFKKGSRLKLEIDAHKGLKKPFYLIFQVDRHDTPGAFKLTLLEDSSGRLTRLFDLLEWEIEVKPSSIAQGKQSQIIASAFAHTHHWRSRLFGRIAEKIMMNQIYYPDLVKLAELRQPFSAEIPPLSLGFSGSGQ